MKVKPSVPKDNPTGDSNTPSPSLLTHFFSFFNSQQSVSAQNKIIFLNPWQAEALKKFKNDGLTAQMLHDNDGEFDMYHYQALVELVERQSYLIKDALTVLKDLENDQVYGIKKGLTRKEVESLTSYQIRAFGKLKNNGLTAQMLQDYDSVFDIYHYDALVKLVRKRGYLIEDALATIKGLDSGKVYGIKKGLTREEVESLTSYQIRAYAELKHYGLTTQMLRDYKGEFDIFHYEALVTLVKKRGYLIEDALTTIEGLDSGQACGINDGLTREDVECLNSWQISSLVELKSYGLTTQMLLDYDGVFDIDQHIALANLVKNQDYSIKAALAAIENLDSEQEDSIGETNMMRCTLY